MLYSSFTVQSTSRLLLNNLCPPTSNSCNISYSLQVLTKNGVFEKKINRVTHAGTEKIRRAELLSCYQQLGSTFLPQEVLCRTNRHDILELVFMKISSPFIF